MREYWNKFKEFRKDPKKKSISLTIFYGIFFLFIIVCARSGNLNSNSNIDSENTINEENVLSYEYNYEITINNDVIKVDGLFYDNKELLKIGNEKYYIQNNKVFFNNESEEVELNYPFLYLNYSLLKDFFNSYSYESKTDYKDKSVKYEYSISNMEIAKLFKDEKYNEGMTNIIVYEKDYIDKIEMNLASYYGFDKYYLVINYNNVNNISNVQVNELG